MADLELLSILGDYGLERTKSFPELFYPNRDGYHVSLLMGDARGLSRWVLTYDTLNDDSQCPVTLPEGGTATPFDYYREFFDRHHAPRKPFRIICPEDSQEYTVMFEESARSLRYRSFQLWAASGGVPIIQFRAEDGYEYQGVSESNPLTI